MTQTRKIFEHAQELSGRMIVRGVSIGPLPLDEAMALVIQTLDEEGDRIEALVALHQAAVQDALAAEAYAEELEDRVRNMIDRIEYLVAQNDQLEAKLAQSVIAEYDDGSQMHLFSHAGGASVGGAWSELTIRHDLPDGTSMLRDYKAAGDWYAFPVAELKGQNDD